MVEAAEVARAPGGELGRRGEARADLGERLRAGGSLADQVQALLRGTS